MNLLEADVLKSLLYRPYINQREVAVATGHSIGAVNKSLRLLNESGYIDENMQPTEKAKNEVKEKAPKNAIILAAGFGMRMVPINLSTPKGLLEVNGKRLIDRIITYLREEGIEDITVVVGFMKDSFEYLIDEYNVNLVYNPDYTTYNNLHSLALVANIIHNTYIIPCDILCYKNPFSKVELYSWYMISDDIVDYSDVRVNRKMELVSVHNNEDGNSMVGISYLLEPEASIIRKQLKAMDNNEHVSDFWESTLYKKDRMIVHAKIIGHDEVAEINTYEQLRDLDSNSNYLKSDAIETIVKALKCTHTDVVGISILKKGMTNRSFVFEVSGSKYIMRIPGEGTDKLINRKQEAEVYRTIKGLRLCDDPVLIDPGNGYKITRFLDGARVCDCENDDDLKKCMDKLKAFHEMKIVVPHTFDIFEQIEFYESLWEGDPSVYRDYAKTKENVLSLKSFIDGVEKDWCLTHIDAVPDNFIFYNSDDNEKLQLIDWEYSGMQDPHVDIAMFCIYSLYDKQHCDHLIDIYFNDNCEQIVRAKIYAYIAICGLLWSNWCEYKRKLGVEFGEYSLRQYRFAKDYYKYTIDALKCANIKEVK